jgi:hypothetical protein
MPDKRTAIVRDQKPAQVNLQRTSVAAVTPAYYQSEYPQLVQFLEKYFEYIRETAGFGDLLAKLKDVRNFDITEEEYAKILLTEYGADFPDLSTIDENLAIRIFEYWYKSKGTKEAIEAYFRVFLNTEAEVQFPRDNMFIIDGGEWDDDEDRYLNTNSHLDEVSMVIQDDYFYQVYSYLIKSGVSFVDWGTTFNNVAHPAGWNVFGQVQISSQASFAVGTKSPTIVPGFQVKDANVLILGAAAHAMGASAQVIMKTYRLLQTAETQDFNFEDVNINLLKSTYRISSFHDVQIGNFREDVAASTPTTRMRPARIDIV